MPPHSDAEGDPSDRNRPLPPNAKPPTRRRGKGLHANSAQPGAIVEIFCYADIRAGEFTVPASILSQIPASGPRGPGIPRSNIFISTTGGGARLHAPGVDYFTASYSWSTSALTDFR